jgi:hypothetical protein
VELNEQAVQILARGVQLRESGSIAAILLLTNNGSPEYIEGVLQRIQANVIGTTGIQKNVFDWVSYSTSPERGNETISKELRYRKDISVVRRMIYNLNNAREAQGIPPISLSLDSIRKKVFFFDDQEHPFMRRDLEVVPDQYIKITPPFDGYPVVDGSPNTFSNDQTDYSPLNKIPGWNDFTESVLRYGGKRNKNIQRKRNLRNTIKLSPRRVRKSRSKRYKDVL